jgi:transcriptional regulator with XRE-family HTH domain
MTTLAKRIGAELRALREAAKVNQTMIADALGVHQMYVSKIEAGRAPLALETWCVAYAAALGHELRLTYTLKPIPSGVEAVQLPKTRVLGYEMIKATTHTYRKPILGYTAEDVRALLTALGVMEDGDAKR